MVGLGHTVTLLRILLIRLVSINVSVLYFLPPPSLMGISDNLFLARALFGVIFMLWNGVELSQ